MFIFGVIIGAGIVGYIATQYNFDIKDGSLSVTKK